MRRWLLALALLIPCALQAQMLTMSGHIYVSAHKPLASGTISFQPTDANGVPISYRFGGGGQSTSNPVTLTLAADGWFSLPLPDTHLTNPQNVCFRTKVKDNQGNDLFGYNYACVQPSLDTSAPTPQNPQGGAGYGWCDTVAQACNFDKYIPPTRPLVVQNIAGTIQNTYVNPSYGPAGTVQASNGSGGFQAAQIAYVNVSKYPGSLTQQVTAAEADPANAGKNVVFSISQSGSLGGVSLNPNHHYYISADVTFTGYVIPSTNNYIACAPGAQLIMGAGVPLNPDGENSFFWAPAGTVVSNFTVNGCTVNGYGAVSGFLFDAAGKSIDVTLTNNHTYYADLFKQNSGVPTDPALRLTVTGNWCSFDHWFVQNGANQPHPNGNCVLIYGPMQHALVATNHFTYVQYGVQLFANGGISGANPANSEADAMASGLQDNLIEDNECSNVRACAWESGSGPNNFIGNTAKICFDVCFDAEDSAGAIFKANVASGANNYLFAQEYGGWNNSFDGNTAPYGGTMFGNTSPTYHSVYNANTYRSPNGVDVALYVQSADDQDEFTNNDLLNGLIAYATYIGNRTVQHNVLKFTQPIPTANIGAPQTGGCGIDLGNINDSTTSLSKDNTIWTTVPQSVAALCMATSASNTKVSYYSDHDTIMGSWALDVSAGASGTNPVNPPSFVLRNTQFSSGKVSTSSKNGVVPQVVCTGGHIGNAGSLATLNVTGSTTAQQTCTN